MRYSEIFSNGKSIVLQINNDEGDLLDKITEEKQVSKKDLSAREQEIARQLVTRGVLKRIMKDDEICFEVRRKA